MLTTNLNFSLDGKTVSNAGSTSSTQYAVRRGVPDYEFKIGLLTFARNIRSSSNNGESKNDKGFKPFGGAGTALKAKASTSS